MAIDHTPNVIELGERAYRLMLSEFVEQETGKYLVCPEDWILSDADKQERQER